MGTILEFQPKRNEKSKVLELELPKTDPIFQFNLFHILYNSGYKPRFINSPRSNPKLEVISTKHLNLDEIAELINHSLYGFHYNFDPKECCLNIEDPRDLKFERLLLEEELSLRTSFKSLISQTTHSTIIARTHNEIYFTFPQLPIKQYGACLKQIINKKILKKSVNKDLLTNIGNPIVYIPWGSIIEYDTNILQIRQAREKQKQA